MTVHIILLLYISCLGAYLYSKKPFARNANKIFVVFSFLAIFIIQSLRGSHVGLDTSSYILQFRLARLGLYQKSWEFLFGLLIRTIAQFTNNPQFFLSACSLIILTGFGILIIMNTPDDEAAFWPVFFFVVFTQYFSSMNLLRQSLSMAVGCNIYSVLKRGQGRKEYAICILLLLVSSLFHTVGLIQIVFFLPYVLKLNRKSIFIGVLFIIILYVAYPFFINLFLWVFPRYRLYLSGRWDFGRGMGSNVVFALVEIIMMVLYCVFFDPENEDNQQKYRLLVISMCSLALITLQRRISLAMRLGYYFDLFLILLIPEFINNWKKAVSRMCLKVAAYLLGWSFYIYSMTVTGARGCVPYSFFWQ